MQNLTELLLSSSLPSNISNKTSNITDTKLAVIIDHGTAVQNEAARLLQSVLLFAHYLIVLPVLLLCWFSIVRCLRHHGLISARNAADLLSDQQLSELRKAGGIASRISPMATDFRVMTAMPPINR